MNILQMLQKKSKFFYLFIVALATVNSVFYSGILIFINNTVTGNNVPYVAKYDWAIFTLLIGVSLVSSKVFQTYLTRLTREIVFEYETSILNKLKFAQFELYERIGNEKVYTAIGDSRLLANIPSSFISSLNAAITILCCLVYIFWTSPAGGAIILTLMAVLLVFYMERNKVVEKDLVKMRDIQDEYYRYLNDLLLGFKEIRMSSVRNENIYSRYLIENRSLTKTLGIKTALRHLNNELMGSTSWYVVLGAAMFGLPMLFDLDLKHTTTFIVTILFLMGPVANLISLIPFYSNVKIALRRLNSFDKQMEITANAPLPPAVKFEQEFESIRFEGLTYKYFDELEQKAFVLGPLHLEVKKGEVIFITGGNGSGKSTFINLFTGLYKPSGGRIIVNGLEISNDKYSCYKDCMAAVFTSSYLFSENYDNFDIGAANGKLNELIEMMFLSDKLRIKDGKAIFDNKLSKGQQKRLAMIYALMEERQILVLDEWAAEQDPKFRDYFYRSLLAEFKKMGKTVIAVTHDDEYYPCADRVIKFDYGNIASDTRQPVAEGVI